MSARMNNHGQLSACVVGPFFAVAGLAETVRREFELKALWIQAARRVQVRALFWRASTASFAHHFRNAWCCLGRQLVARGP